MMKTISVQTDTTQYDVLAGQGLSAQLTDLVGGMDASQAILISETIVDPLHGDAIQAALEAAGLDVLRLVFPAGEANKTLSTIEELLDHILTARPPIDRKTVVVGLGGGVATDMAGFAAAITLRGLRWVGCSTSLLGAVDASVGGKTGVDHNAGKNLIGAFHQPSGVLIDVNLLRTLPHAELVNGLAECVKHGVIRDITLLDFLETHADALLAQNDQGELTFPAELMTELIARNVAIKAEVVSQDEKEAGLRAILNFGHTAGHAIETMLGYEDFQHGKCVSLGMIVANYLAVQRGLLTPTDAVRISDLLKRLGLPTALHGLDVETILDIMKRDKKAVAGVIRFVLVGPLGKASIIDDISDDEIRQALSQL